MSLDNNNEDGKGLIAIISDIHANKKALDIVLDDISHRKIKRIVCLGDIIGYGKDPIYVVDQARMEIFEEVLKGNHDEGSEMVSQANMSAKGIANLIHVNNAAAETIVEHTKTLQELNNNGEPSEEGEARIDYLRDLPEDPVQIRDDVLCVHAPIGKDGMRKYAMTWEFAEEYGIKNITDICMKPEKLFADKTYFPEGKRILFVGHTHMHYAYIDDGEDIYEFKFERETTSSDGQKSEVERFIPLRDDERIIVNVGAVNDSRMKDKSFINIAKEKKFEADTPIYYSILHPDKIEFVEIYYNPNI